MDAFFQSGHVIDAIVIMMGVEVVGLALYRRLTRLGPRVIDVAPNIAAGFFLMMALRQALLLKAWPFIALPLMAALISHLVDLKHRWRSERQD